MGDTLANTWDASWQDAQTGKPMLGRGTEIWLVRDGRIALWDATFNVWEKGGPQRRRSCSKSAPPLSLFLAVADYSFGAPSGVRSSFAAGMWVSQPPPSAL